MTSLSAVGLEPAVPTATVKPALPVDSRAQAVDRVGRDGIEGAAERLLYGGGIAFRIGLALGTVALVAAIGAIVFPGAATIFAPVFGAALVGASASFVTTLIVHLTASGIA